MPRVAVWFVRIALIHLALGFTLGAVLLWHKAWPLGAAAWLWRPAHAEFLLMGWTAQLVLGVALWIFPRRRLGSYPYGPEALAWLGFALLNAGVWLVALGSLAGGGAGEPLTLAGRLLEIAAVGVCALNLWSRVRPGLSGM